MSDPAERAVEEWDVVINPFPLFGELLYMLYFRHRSHPFRFFYRQYTSHRDAEQELRRVRVDLSAMRCDKFKEKYHIGYDLKGSIL